MEKNIKDAKQHEIIRLKRRGSTIFQFVLYPTFDGIKLLPIVSSGKTTLTIKGYTIIDVPADGNCAFTAVRVAQGNKEFIAGMGTQLAKNHLENVKGLRNSTANEMQKVVTDRPNFIEMLRQPGFWNSGIDGAVGVEVLSFVAEVIKQPILVITQEPNDQYRYWISGTMKNPRDGNLNFYDIEEKDLERLLDANPNAIKLFHNGIHFQAIVKKDSSLPVMPPSPLIDSASLLKKDAFPGTSRIPDMDTGVPPFADPLLTGTPPCLTEDQETIPQVVVEELASVGYHIQDVPGDGNCGIWAVLVAKGEITQIQLKALMDAYNPISNNYSPSWNECWEKLIEASKDSVGRMFDLREACDTSPGQWVSGEDLPKISGEIKRPIILVQMKDGILTYTLYSNENGVEILTGTIDQIFMNHPNAIFIYYNGTNHFQAIVKNT